MDHEWNDNLPIYRQLRDRVVAMILDGVLKEGDPLPSVRNVAAEYRVNPLTVLKAYQQLVDEQLVEKRRGLGMFVKNDSRKLVLRNEREKFLTEEWPRICATIERLGLSSNELLDDANRRAESAISALCRTVAVICSRLAAVRSRLEAWFMAPSAIARDEVANSPDASVIPSIPNSVCAITDRMVLRCSCNSARLLAVSAVFLLNTAAR